MTEFAGKNVLITGAAKGIGRQLALRVAQRGGTAILWDLDREALTEAVAEVERVGDRPAFGYACDVADRDQVYASASEVRDQAGDVDILVNNAGVVSGAAFLDIPDQQLETTLRVNTLALFWTSKAFLPRMVERNSGHLVTVASAAGLIGTRRMSDYSASKFAAVGFDESLRMELHKTAPDVRTTVVCPFYVNTGLFEGVRSRSRLLLPILDEGDVADRICRAIERDRARLYTPAIVYLTPLLKAVLPVPVFDRLVSRIGINACMDGFVGRQYRDSGAAAAAGETS